MNHSTEILDPPYDLMEPAKQLKFIDEAHDSRHEDSALFSSAGEVGIAVEDLLHVQIHFPGSKSEAACFLKKLRASISPLARDYSIDCSDSFVRPFSIECFGIPVWLKAVHAAFPCTHRRAVAFAELLARAAALAGQMGKLNGYLTSRSLFVEKPTFVLADIRMLGFNAEKASDSEVMTHPPEIIQNGTAMLTSCCDSYAVGNILFQVLCNRQVFTSSGETLRHNILNEDPDFPSSVNPMVSGHLSAICERALSRKVYWRYQETTELADDLRGYIEHKRTRAVRSRRRRTVRSGGKLLVASLMLIVLIASIAVVWPVLCDLENDYDMGVDSYYEDAGDF